ncbi:B3 domain-containing protein Os12g0592300 [Striga asiatica]|uniref:B3 domain-containing protein Os12g0592300 n=1 Tax=Striga asiatica TaxID=4170 RepID=A0A5A7Q3M8_STRAF|nr:B3 domain-containing protein Os12g0592300 [Striga asiatica]
MERTDQNIRNTRRRRADKGRRSWSKHEEEILIVALKEVVANGWKSENGFKTGFLQVLEQELAKKLPGTDLKGLPHINSKIHVWKKDYSSLLFMLSRTGMGWNDSTKMVEASDEAWASCVKVDPNARLMRYKSWPYYPDWVNIFGKDRATGEHAEDIGNAASQPFHDATGVLPDFVKAEAEADLGGDDPDWMTSESESRAQGSTSSRKSKGSKRKSTQANEDMTSVFRNFCSETGVRLREIAQKIGYEYDVSAARKEVYYEVGKILGLNMQEKLVSLPPAICEYHESELPKKCIIETREGREYEVMMKMVDNDPTLVDGWDTYIQQEYIELHNILFFKRKSKFRFDVMVTDKTGLERPPIHHFCLDIKKSHIERARLPIPMPFWRDHIKDNYDNYTTAVLIFDNKVYEVDVIHGNGKKLLQYRGARKFVTDSGIVVGSSCMFTHVGPHNQDDVITFRVKI